MSSSPYRVIQWGTGTIGAEMITTILDHRPDLELAAVMPTVLSTPRASVESTSMEVLNAVPAVCDAPPGFATMASLPLIRSHTRIAHT